MQSVEKRFELKYNCDVKSRKVHVIYGHLKIRFFHIVCRRFLSSFSYCGYNPTILAGAKPYQVIFRPRIAPCMVASNENLLLPLPVE
jgi:hypothetical protein